MDYAYLRSSQNASERPAPRAGLTENYGPNVEHISDGGGLFPPGRWPEQRRAQ